MIPSFLDVEERVHLVYPVEKNPKELAKVANSIGVKLTLGTRRTSKDHLNDNVDKIIAALRVRICAFADWLASICDQAIAIPHDLDYFKLREILYPIDKQMNEYLAKVFRNLGVTTSMMPFRGHLCNVTRWTILQAVVDIGKMHQQQSLVRRSFYLSKFGIVASELVQESSWKNELSIVGEDFRRYKFALVRDEHQPNFSQLISSLRSFADCNTTVDLLESKWWYIAYAIVQGFQYSERALPESQYVSLLWAPLFQSALTFSDSKNFIFGSTEFRLNSISSYKDNHFADFSFCLKATSADGTEFEAPIFLAEASGFHRSNDCCQFVLMKDWVKNAVSMLHCFYYWLGALPKNSKFEEDLRVYGAFMNKTELQLCCLIIKKDFIGDQRSFIYQTGEEYSFDISHLGMEGRDHIFRRLSDLNAFDGNFKISQSLQEFSASHKDIGYHDPTMDLPDEVTSQNEIANDFSTTTDEQICQYLAIIDSFFQDVFDYGKTLREFIETQTNIHPGNPPPEMPHEFPQSPSSHFSSSPRKDYGTPKPQKHQRKTEQQSPETPTKTKENSARNYADTKNLVIDDMETKNHWCLAQCHTGTEKSVILVKDILPSSQEPLCLSKLRFGNHIVKLYDVEMVEESQHLILHLELLETVKFGGGPLRSFLPVMIEFLIDGLMGLLEMKQVNLVHGDISPGNIMFSPRDQCYKFLDFDRAFFADDIPSKSSYIGTKGFTAPELEDGNVATFASDMYSFGSLVYTFPFQTLIDLVLWSNNLDDEIFTTLEVLVGQMISRDPQTRPTVEEALGSVWNYWTKHSDNFEHNRYSDMCSLDAKIQHLKYQKPYIIDSETEVNHSEGKGEEAPCTFESAVAMIRTTEENVEAQHITK